MPPITKSERCVHTKAVIDIGANTIRLLIGCIDNGKLIRIESDREVTRLGKDLMSTGKLNQQSVDLTISSLIKFKAKCDTYGVGRIIAVGTSALRDAGDKDQFLEIAKEMSGLDIEIISGEKEADLTLKGIRWQKKFFSVSPCTVIIDVGGGSTEIIACNACNIKTSIPLGAVKLQEIFIKTDPPALHEITAMKDFILSELNKVVPEIKNQTHQKSCSVVATGGTPTTLAAMHIGMKRYDGDKIHGRRLSYSSIKSMFERLVALPLQRRLSITGLEKGRADIIIPGTLIIIVLMELLNSTELLISDYGLMEGILLDASDAA